MNQLGNLFEQLLPAGATLETVFFGNTLSVYLAALGVFLVLLAIFKVFQMMVLRKLEQLARRSETDIDDTLIEIARSLRPSFYSFLAFFIALQTLSLDEFVRQAINVVLVVWVTYQVIVGVQIFINYLVTRGAAKDRDPTTKSALEVLGRIAKGILWGIGALMVLSNLGVDVSSLLAGVGIGGIAIAFAFQSILGDLFSSFAIYFDKPFKVGDFIVVGEHLGTVERVGIKTTRLRALGGEELVMANQELTASRVQNYGKLEERRVVFSFGIVYETPPEKIRAAGDIARDVIEHGGKTRLERVHLTSFGDSALVFEAVYYVLSPDYNEYMDIHQEILLAIKERFEKEGIEFAYPTYLVHTRAA